MFGDGGRFLAAYDKVHLVPFGEYLPFQAALEAVGLQSLTAAARRLYQWGGAPSALAPARAARAGALICYEAIFPRAVVAGPERPSLSSISPTMVGSATQTGPRQHMQQRARTGGGGGAAIAARGQ